MSEGSGRLDERAESRRSRPLLHLRIFLSSPGDIVEERDLARRIIRDELAVDAFLRGRLTFDVVSWDDPASPSAMLANLTPQEAINRGLARPSECDFVVVVLWSRMGTPLPDDCRRPSGEPYLSGTEWEYEDALNAVPQPDILVYRRAEAPKIPLNDPELDEKRQQYAKVEQFFARFKAADGSISGGFTTYAAPSEFGARLKSDLRQLLQPLMEAALASSAHALDDDMEAARRRLARASRLLAGEPARRIAGVRPQGLSEHFRDRVKVAADITEMLLVSERFRAVVVAGRGGIGKTALACKVMAALERDERRINGIAYLGTRSTGVDLRTIYFTAATLLGGTERQHLEGAWSDTPGTAQRNVQRILEALARGRYAVLIDNLEDLLDPAGELRDEELRLFFELFLALDHGARMLVTTREEPTLPSSVLKYRAVVPLDDGLDATDTAELLRELDQTGKLRLRDADPATLRAVHEKTDGDPKRLESIVGLLSRNPFVSLPRLLADRDLWDREVTETLARMAYEGLDREGRLVMQALAVFDRPVPQAALSWVLEPYLGEAEVSAAALKLWRGRFLNIDRATGDVDLHRIDREYSYAQVPRDSSAEPNLRQLERRAAGYYRRLRLGREEWRSLGALEPQFREFEHLVRAEEHDVAAALLSDIDVGHLIYHGHARLVRDMRQRLEGRIREPRLRMLHEHALGQCFLTIGPFQEAVSRFQRALPLATELHDRQAEAAISERLGTTYRLMGALPEAETRLSRAVEISRELGAAATESTSAFSLGLVLAYRGKFSAAIARAREALEREERGAGGPLDRQRAHNVLSLAYIALGDAPQALAHARKAFEENEQARFLQGDSVWGAPDIQDAMPYVRNVLGMAQLQLGREHEAAAEFERTVTEARAVEQPRPEGFALFNLARIRRRQGELRCSLELAELSASTLEKLSETAAATASALAAAIRASLAQDARREAQHLLDCAENARDNPDLYDPLELIAEAEVLATEGDWSDLADRAGDLRRTLKKRQAAA